MENSIEFIKISPEDWRDYKVIRLEALKSDPQAFTDTYEKSILYSEDKWKYNLTNNNPIVLLMKDEQKIIGMIGAYEKTKSLMEIWGVYINNKYREKGHGKKMLDKLLIEIKERTYINTVSLNVTTTQKAALSIYIDKGFMMVDKENPNHVSMELKFK